MFKSKEVIAAALFAALGLQSAVADTSFSLGAEYSEGDYGTAETTTSWYVPLGMRYASGDFGASITIPYVSVSGSSLLTADGRPIVPMGSGGMGGMGGGGTTTATTRTDAGLGDVVLGASYQLMSEGESRPWVGTSAKVKLGTADESVGLGTGETDYTLQLEVAKGIFYGYAGYTLLGDTVTTDYNDVSFVGAELGFPVAERSTLSIGYYTETASLDGMDDVQEASLSLSGEMGSDLNYSLYYVAGLSDSTADSVVGINISSRMK